MDIVSDLNILEGSKINVKTSDLVFSDLGDETFSEFKNDIVFNNTSASKSLAIGWPDGVADSQNAVQIGNCVWAAPEGVAIGVSSRARGESSIVIGNGASANGTGSIIIGKNAQSYYYCAIAIGSRAAASADMSIAFGSNAKAQFVHSTAIGYYATASGRGETVFSAWDDTTCNKTQFSIIGEGSTIANSEFGGCAGITYATYRGSGRILSEFGSAKLSDIVKTSKIFTSDNEFTGTNTFNNGISVYTESNFNTNDASPTKTFEILSSGNSGENGSQVLFCGASIISFHGPSQIEFNAATPLIVGTTVSTNLAYNLKFKQPPYSEDQVFAYESDLPKYETVSNVEVPADCSAFSMPFTKSFKNCPTYSFVDNEFNTVIADIKFVKDTNTSEFNSATVSVEHDAIIPANSYQLNVFGY